jgi:hypothetical protein
MGILIISFSFGVDLLATLSPPLKGLEGLSHKAYDKSLIDLDPKRKTNIVHTKRNLR